MIDQLDLMRVLEKYRGDAVVMPAEAGGQTSIRVIEAQWWRRAGAMRTSAPIDGRMSTGDRVDEHRGGHAPRSDQAQDQTKNE